MFRHFHAHIFQLVIHLSADSIPLSFSGLNTARFAPKSAPKYPGIEDYPHPVTPADGYWVIACHLMTLFVVS